MAFRRRKNTAAIHRTAPSFEHIVTEASDSFLWRLDDYPWERNVWNFHPEYEIHLLHLIGPLMSRLFVPFFVRVARFVRCAADRSHRCQNLRSDHRSP